MTGDTREDGPVNVDTWNGGW